MPVSRQQPICRRIALALLASILGFLTQPRIDALYHVHQGGEHAHVHTHLLVSPIVDHHDDHSHHHHHDSHLSHHHQHPHDVSVHHIHEHAPSHVEQHKPAGIRQAHHHAKGHWHTWVALHWAGRIALSPTLPNLPSQPLTEEKAVTTLCSLVFIVRSRAPPSLS